MKIDLSQVRIEFPEKPTKIWDHHSKACFQDYRVFGYFGEEQIGHITVSLCQLMEDSEKCDFWFEKKKKVWIPRPVAVFQRTESGYKGQGVSGKLLVLVNETVKSKYNMPLASDLTFCRRSPQEYDERVFAERPAMRVWEKLEEQELAYRRDYHHKPRWIMK
jgi:hypothetical protein